jgi:hypothetical protein
MARLPGVRQGAGSPAGSPDQQLWSSINEQGACTAIALLLPYNWQAVCRVTALYKKERPSDIDGSRTLLPVCCRIADLRANAARHAAAASGSSPGGAVTQQELMRRLRDTQALLIKFSEENGRLSADNQMLQAGRKVLGVEHASVLDEIGEAPGLRVVGVG